MKMKLKNKIKACAAILPVLFTTACMNHMENGEYVSTGEILAGAFGNLVIGMGTVFAVLIFLTWVISLFKYVPKLVEGFGKSRKDKAAAAKGKTAQGAKGGPAPAATAGSWPAATAPAAAASSGTGGARVTSITPTPSDGEVAAVIAAAIAAYEADKEGSGSSIKGALQGGPARPKQGALTNGIRIRTYKRA